MHTYNGQREFFHHRYLSTLFNFTITSFYDRVLDELQIFIKFPSSSINSYLHFQIQLLVWLA